MKLTPQIIKRKIRPVFKRQGVTKAALFGSIVRGKLKRGSDIDILVQFKSGKSLLDLIGLEQELAETLNRKVDVITYKSLHPRLREAILKEQTPIYG